MSTTKLSPFRLRAFLQASIPSVEWTVAMTDRCLLEVSTFDRKDIPPEFVQQLVKPLGWTVVWCEGTIICVPQNFPISRTRLAENGLCCAG